MKGWFFLSFFCYITFFLLFVLRFISHPDFSHRGLDFSLYGISLLCHIVFAVILLKIKIKLQFIFISGLLLRLVALLQPPYTTDLFRYLSDGLNLLAGKNPYLSEPAIAEIDFREMKSMYGITLWPYFALGALLSQLFPQQPLYSFKLLAGFSELFFLIFFTRRLKNQWLLAVLWTSPLLIFENWHEGHLDMVTLIPLIFSFYVFRHYGLSLTALWMAVLAAAMKLHGLILLAWYRFVAKRGCKINPFWLCLSTQWRFDTLWLTIFVALNLAITPTIFYQATLPGSTSGLAMYWASWQHSQPWLYLAKFTGLSQSTAIRLLQLMFVIGCTVLLWKRLRGRIDDSSVFAGWLGCFVFLFPVQHPWYYQLLLLYVLNFRRYRIEALSLMSLVGLNYLSYTPAIAGSVIPQIIVWLLTLFIGFAAKKVSRNWQVKSIG